MGDEGGDPASPRKSEAGDAGFEIDEEAKARLELELSQAAQFKARYIDAVSQLPCAFLNLMAPLPPGKEMVEGMGEKVIQSAASFLASKSGIKKEDISFLDLMEGAPDPKDQRKSLACRCVGVNVRVTSKTPVLAAAEDLETMAKDPSFRLALEKTGADVSQAQAGACLPFQRVKAAIDIKFQEGGRPKYPKLTVSALHDLAPLVVESYKGYTELWKAIYSSDLETFSGFPSDSPIVQGAANAIDKVLNDAAEAQLLMKKTFAGAAPGSTEWANSPFNDRNEVPLDDPRRSWQSGEDHSIPNAALFDPGIKMRDDVLTKAISSIPPWQIVTEESQVPLNKVVDVSRMAAVFEDPACLHKTANWLKDHFGERLLWCDNQFSDPTPLGYRGMNCGVSQVIPGTKRNHVSEFQLQMKSIYDFKQGKGHQLYESLREILQSCGVERGDSASVLEQVLSEVLVTDGQQKANGKEMMEAMIENARKTYAGQKVNLTVKRDLRKLFYQAEKTGVSKDWLRDQAEAIGLGTVVPPVSGEEMESRGLVSSYDRLFTKCTANNAKAASLEERRGKDKQEKSLMYSESNMAVFHKLLNIAKQDCPLYHSEGCFLDLGSGAGKACIAAALMHPFEKVVGIECLQSLNAFTNSALELWADMDPPHGTFKPKVEFIMDDFVSYVGGPKFKDLVEQITVCFSLATCFSERELKGLADVALQLPDESVFITMGQPLPKSVVRNKKLDLSERFAIAQKRTLNKRGMDPVGQVIHVDEPQKNGKEWFLLHDGSMEMAWGPSKYFVYKKGFDPQNERPTFLL